MVLYTDNQPALKIAHKPGYNGRTKHMEIKYFNIQELIKKQIIWLKYCRTDDMLADILTKALSPAVHNRMCKSIGIQKNHDVRGSVEKDGPTTSMEPHASTKLTRA